MPIGEEPDMSVVEVPRRCPRGLLVLEYRDPPAHDKLWSLRAGRALFGLVSIERTWGRRDVWTRQLAEALAERDAAALVRALILLRLRHGYRLVAGRGEVLALWHDLSGGDRNGEILAVAGGTPAANIEDRGAVGENEADAIGDPIAVA
jgi:hypothetical protein